MKNERKLVLTKNTIKNLKISSKVKTGVLATGGCPVDSLQATCGCNPVSAGSASASGKFATGY